MQALYEWDFRDEHDLEPIIERSINTFPGEVDPDYVRSVIGGVTEHLPELDQLISLAAPEWPLDQVAMVDKNVLRIAVFELFHRPDVPAKVAINEAVEIGKTFGGENSSKFVNGVLGTIYREHEAEILSNKTEESKAEKVTKPNES